MFQRIASRLDRIAGIGIEETLFYERRAGSVEANVSVNADIAIERSNAYDPRVFRDVPYTSEKTARSRFDNGDVCYTAYLDDQLAHCSWVRRSGIQAVPEAGLDYPVASGEFWIYHCWTASWARGKRVYPTILTRINADHFAGGYQLARIYTSRTNIASQHGIVRAGFALIYTRRALWFGSHRWSIGGERRNLVRAQNQ